MGPFSALLPVSGGIAPTTGMAQEEAWSSMCPHVALQTDSDPAMLSGETLQALWHQKQDRNVTGLSLTSPFCLPCPIFLAAAQFADPASSEQRQHLLACISFGGAAGHIFTHEGKQMQISDLVPDWGRVHFSG